MVNFLQRIQNNAGNHPKTTAIQHGKEKISYEDLSTQILNVRDSARRNGLGEGTNIAFLCKPSLQSLTFALGLLAAGSCLTVIDPFTSDELFHSRLRKAKTTHVLADSKVLFAGRHQRLVSKVTKKHIANVNEVDTPVLKFEELKSWLNDSNLPMRSLSLDETSPAIIVFTSGTTSEPKGVVHTLQTLSVNIDPVAEAFNLTANQKVFSEPMTLGLVALSVGATWIIPTSTQIPEVDLWFATPKEILDGLRNKRSSRNVKHVAVASAPVLLSLVDDLVNHFGDDTKIHNVYGMTEMLPIAVGNAKLKRNHLDKGDYLGHLIGDAQAKIVDGEIVISGSALSPKYLHTRKYYELKTGDLGEIIDDGSLILHGRKKDMFIRGSMNIYPSLYEPQISSIEGVEDAVLTGKPDKYGDDVIYLVVTAKPGFKLENVITSVKQNMGRMFDSKALPDHVVGMQKLALSGRANKWDRAAIAAEAEHKINA